MKKALQRIFYDLMVAVTTVLFLCQAFLAVVCLNHNLYTDALVLSALSLLNGLMADFWSNRKRDLLKENAEPSKEVKDE